MLTNREFNIIGKCSASIDFLKSYKSVVKAEFIDTTSSGGDWNGFFVQKIYGNYYLIPFSQEPKFAVLEMSIYTFEPIEVFKELPETGILKRIATEYLYE